MSLSVLRGNSKEEITLTKPEMLNWQEIFTNKAKGIGTLTYIHPTSKKFGALGHPIMLDKQEILPQLLAGEIFRAEILRVQKSSPGVPGYKIAKNDPSPDEIGIVEFNTALGVFGKITDTRMLKNRAYETLSVKEIEHGDAVIRTTISGNNIREFHIDITEIHPPSFTFEVTDPELIKETGGILQGMSGSPILQGDRFIGAITHMVVEKPLKGTAIGIEEMIKME